MKRAGGRRGEADEASSLVSELEVNEGNWQQLAAQGSRAGPCSLLQCS